MHITIFDETSTRVALLKLTVPPSVGDILHVSQGDNQSAAFKVVSRTCYTKDMSDPKNLAEHDDVASWMLRVERVCAKL